MMMCVRPIWGNLKTLQEIKRKTENRKADHVHGQEDSISQKKKTKNRNSLLKRCKRNDNFASVWGH